MNKFLLYYYTIKDLKLIQLRYQLRNRMKHKLKTKGSDKKKLSFRANDKYNLYVHELDASTDYLSRFNVDEIKMHTVTLLNESHVVNFDLWRVPEASHLWNYNLHYLEFLIPIALKYRETKDIEWYKVWKEYVESWMKQSSYDSREPYTISIRIPNLLIAMEVLGEVLKQDDQFYNLLNENIYKQYIYLQSNLEYRLLANHLFENIKAIIIASLYYGEKVIYKKTVKKLKKEIKEQILSDGMHYELSIMYHHIILEDLLRLYLMMTSCGEKSDAVDLEEAIKKMTSAMCSIEKGTNRIPLFNDAGNNVAKSANALKNSVEKICKCKIEEDKVVFSESGYAKLYANSATLIFDAGPLGPRYMSGHAHNDCLSFELFVKGRPLIVNSGTLLYQGAERRYFRSTEAHNTFMIDNRQQAQLWGEHRAGKKHKCQLLSEADNKLIGSFVTQFGDRCARTIEGNNNAIIISDCVETNDHNQHCMRTFFHLAPEYSLEADKISRKIIIVSRNENKRIAYFKCPEECQIIIHRGKENICKYADEFGKMQYVDALELKKLYKESCDSIVNIILEDK